ncbi:site-specific integrase [Salisaeta longa]|uniref:site-specific integrase n=1 Tax=Salisaeta longa TaxID=503170 RepID=UPI0003B33D2B|nr:site-specific integrase [Salisaeta longa]
MSTSPHESSSLLDRVRAACRRKGYSYRTEQTYTRWIVRYVKYHDTTHPRHLEKSDVRTYLSYLATERNVAASTQNQALNALVVLYDRVLETELGAIGGITPPQRTKKRPPVPEGPEGRVRSNPVLPQKQR